MTKQVKKSDETVLTCKEKNNIKNTDIFMHYFFKILIETLFQ